MKIEIWSDILCPFCYIGKRCFESALAQSERPEEIEVVWKSFELNPDAKSEPDVSIYEHLAAKYGRSEEWARQANQNLVAQGSQAGIRFDFDGVHPTNSFAAHRLLHLARRSGKESDVLDRLFAAYFSQGQDISRSDVLETIAAEVGLDGAEVKNLFTGDAFASDVRSDEEEARSLGLTGVPAFVFERKFLISGAQPVEAFVQAIEQIRHAPRT